MKIKWTYVQITWSTNPIFLWNGYKGYWIYNKEQFNFFKQNKIDLLEQSSRNLKWVLSFDNGQAKIISKKQVEEKFKYKSKWKKINWNY